MVISHDLPGPASAQSKAAPSPQRSGSSSSSTKQSRDLPPQSKAAPSPQRSGSSSSSEPSCAFWFIVVVVCDAANVAWSTKVQWFATDSVGELRRRCERAAGRSRSDYLLVESTRKPMRDHLLVQDYGLNISQRVRLVTDGDGSRLRGGARGARARTAAFPRGLLQWWRPASTCCRSCWMRSMGSAS